MKEKRSVLVGWGLSYMIVLLIPIISIFINYAYNTRIIKGETIKANELILDNLRDNFDKYLQEEKSFYTYIFSNFVCRSVASNLNKDAQFYYDAARLQQHIKNHNSYIQELSCLIYIPDKDYLVANSGANDSRYFYESLSISFPMEIEYENWLERLNAEYQNQFFVDKYLHYNTGESCVVYADSVAYEGYEKINIFISIPVTALEKMAESLAADTGFSLVIEDELVLTLTNQGMQEISEEEKAMCLANEGNSFETENNIGIWEYSDIDNIEYNLLISKDDFWKETLYVRNVFSVSVMVTLFVGFVCVSLLLKRNFKPVSELVSKTVGNFGKGNEFQLIENAYTNLKDENHAMYKRIMSQMEIVQSNYLLSMMKGRTIKNQEEIIPVRLGQKIALAGICVPLCDEKKLQYDELMIFVVDNIFSELMEDNVFYRVEEGRYLFYMFLIDGDGSAWKTCCMEKAGYLCDIMKDKWEVPLVVAVSGIEEKIENLRFLYQEIIETFEEMRLLGKAGITDTESKYQSENGNNRIVQSVIEYVEAHYTDADLNLTAIADGIGKNPKYISRVFKEEKQESILDYLNRRRIEKTQVLLRTRQYTVEQVGEMAGYANVKTFRRIFTKSVGVTPGKYMEETGDKK